MKNVSRTPDPSFPGPIFYPNCSGFLAAVSLPVKVWAAWWIGLQWDEFTVEKQAWRAQLLTPEYPFRGRWCQVGVLATHPGDVLLLIRFRLALCTNSTARQQTIIRSPHCLKLEAFFVSCQEIYLQAEGKYHFDLRVTSWVSAAHVNHPENISWTAAHYIMFIPALYVTNRTAPVSDTIYFYITKDIFVYMTYIFTTATMWCFLTVWKQPGRPSVTTEVKKSQTNLTSTFYFQFLR